MSILIFHQFDDCDHGITVEKLDADDGFRVTVYQGKVQTNHVLTESEAADMAAVIDANNVAE